MCCAVIDNYPRAQVKYTFIDRNSTVYPHGFAKELSEQIKALESLSISEDEIAFMKHRCPYIPFWFYTFLKGYRYNPDRVHVSQDCDGHLSVEIEGCWSDTILFEVKILAIVSELYYEMTGEAKKFDLEKYYTTSRAKASRLIEAGCTFSDFGTRRRASFETQDTVVRAMAECDRSTDGQGKFIGTSNVYFAMKYDLVPVGTMAHELNMCYCGDVWAANGKLYGHESMVGHLQGRTRDISL